MIFMTEPTNHFRMARLRIDRAFLSLTDEITMPSGQPIDAVVLSRLIIALNSLATGLSEASERRGAECKSAAREASEILWSIGEKAGKIAPAIHMRDDARPPQ
jgi:hypothetical protein